jgi:hypothetical protein
MSTWALKNYENGEPWLAGSTFITAGMQKYDGKSVLAGKLGNLTNWTLQTKH